MARGATFALGVALGLSIAQAGTAANYRTLYSFTGGTDGNNPRSGLALDADGNLYGTAALGGTVDKGVVFRVAQDGSYALLHDFKGGRDGDTPAPVSLAFDAHGALYGTTLYGGRSNGGTVFTRKPDGSFKILHSFGLGSDGFWPYAGVALDRAGNIYGTTQAGGGACSEINGCGIAFKLTRGGEETVLHAFAGGGDGILPIGTPLLDGDGNLYGTTYNGGTFGHGTVFIIAPDGGETVLNAFSGSPQHPQAALIRDKHGNLYGMTAELNNAFTGAIFKLTQSGKSSILHTFGKTDGAATGLTGLVRDRQGNLYGATSVGGGADCGQAGGCGMVFMIAPDGTETTLHAFGNDAGDGLFPNGGVVSDGHGNFYGTTMWGGAFDHGTVFELSTGAK